RRGALITALPLDSVIGASAERLGFEVIWGSMAESFRRLGGRRFDCVLISDLLHLQSEPRRLLEQLSGFVKDGGALVIDGPNFLSTRMLLKFAWRRRDYGRLYNFSTSGIRV